MILRYKIPKYESGRAVQKVALLVSLLVLMTPFAGRTQETLELPLPLDVIAGPAPMPVKADGRIRLLYELRFADFGSSIPLELSRLEVIGDGRLIASYEGKAIDRLLTTIGPTSAGTTARRLEPGRTAIMFLDIALPPGAPAPLQLAHRVTVRDTDAGRTETVDGPALEVPQKSPRVIGPPVRGSRWDAAFGLSDRDNHRRSLVTNNGKTWLPDRFAIDWVQLGPDGRLFHGDASRNSNFYDYGADVLAVADGRVVNIVDGIPENAGLNHHRSVPMTVRTIAGNAVILDLGGGVYAAYDHLQPGSIRVRSGQRVETGQVLARLGNSGNAMAPHLHFQLMDQPVHLAGDGIPYHLPTFSQVGEAPSVPLLLSGEAWLPGREAPIMRRREFPLDNAVVNFPSNSPR